MTRWARSQHHQDQEEATKLVAELIVTAHNAQQGVALLAISKRTAPAISPLATINF
jgi:hypothetical protein